MRRSLFFQAFFIVMIGISLLTTGCATIEELISGKNDKVVTDTPEGGLTKFSDTPNVMNPSNRNYKKMTKSKMEEESDLGSSAGSMWVMEGQGAYLFSQNKARREGDLLNVKIEGAAQKQIETKVAVIKKLLKQLEEEEAKAKEQEQNSVPVQGLAANDPNAAKKETARAPASEKKAEEKEEPLEIGMVPTRIVERQADGNYRIKGSQPFMIGKREYKVIVTGIIRPEDFNDEGVSSNKLLDPQFDVVSVRRSLTNEKS
jgi:flagellar L-ring protein precursor FlgH